MKSDGSARTRGESGEKTAGVDRLQHDSTFTTEDAMTLNLSMPNAPFELKPKITVVGVGGAGGNAVNNMIKQNLEGVDFIVANTDAQALAQSLCQRRIQLGTNLTAGLGAGSRPDVGRGAAEEALDEIIRQLQGSNMVFITAGMGGGTGTGAAPVIAAATREQGILTVGVVTKPFHFEGLHRMRVAEAGIKELQQFVDTLIIIPNQNLFRIANEKTTFADAFNMADQVLDCGVRGVTDLMVKPGLINLDFADIRAVMTEMGKAMMGTGEAEGPNRAIGAAEAAISNPLLDDVSMKGARGVLINITGGLDMTLFEVDEAANRIRSEVDPEANIIFGSTFDQSLEGKVRISVVATGIETMAGQMPRPVSLSLVSNGNGGRPAMTAAEPSLGAVHAVAPTQHPRSAATSSVRPRSRCRRRRCPTGGTAGCTAHHAAGHGGGSARHAGPHGATNGGGPDHGPASPSPADGTAPLRGASAGRDDGASGDAGRSGTAGSDGRPDGRPAGEHTGAGGSGAAPPGTEPVQPCHRQCRELGQAGGRAGHHPADAGERSGEAGALGGTGSAGSSAGTAAAAGDQPACGTRGRADDGPSTPDGGSGHAGPCCHPLA